MSSCEIPADYVVPIWRANPNGTGVGTIALDPREADYVLEHGCTIDGEAWAASRGAWGPEPQTDGRVTIRIVKL